MGNLLFIVFFYLSCMQVWDSQIFGYMNILNTEKALSYIGKFPKLNNLSCFKFSDLNFECFGIQVFNDKGIESYKSHFINDFYNTLLSHLLCLSSEESGEEEIRDLLLGSI